LSSTTNAAKVPVSIIIPTKDEERNIAACLESLEWADERIVFDSYSTDRTLEIAEH
jgi:glycosyltransferase involved in cell wall biosynthesis